MSALYSPSQTKRKSLLVIDQIESIRRFVCVNFNLRGYTAHDAPTLEQSIGLLQNWRPDAILLEIPYHEHSWRRWLTNLGALEVIRGIPLIIFTNDPYTLDELKNANQAVAALMTKPVTTATLIQTVEDVLALPKH